MAGLEAYSIGKVIGKGSYGEVFLAKHRKDRKQYVLKKVDLQRASARERKAAELEAKLLSQLRHPNIVSYRESFQDEVGFLYIAMNFCEGGDLYTRLKNQKGQILEETQVVEWFVQIAMALQYMHERHILHRDLKTQNIFLTKSKIIKVGDLGIARVLDSGSDMATTLIGTPYYMSPELFSNKPYNHKSDVWALGCCLYEMCTLRHAFNAKDMSSLVYKILKGKTPPLPKQYSSDLCVIIGNMLDQDPDKRPSVSRLLRHHYIKKQIAVFLEGTKNRQKQKSKVERVPSNDSTKSSGRPPRSSKSDSGFVGSDLQASVATISAVACVIDDGRDVSRPAKAAARVDSSRASVESSTSSSSSSSSKGQTEVCVEELEKDTDENKAVKSKQNAPSKYQLQKERDKEIIKKQMAKRKRSLGEKVASWNAQKPKSQEAKDHVGAPDKETNMTPGLEEKKHIHRVKSAAESGLHSKAKPSAGIKSNTPRQSRPLPRPPQESPSAGVAPSGSRSPRVRRRYKVSSSAHTRSHETEEEEEEESEARCRADSDKSTKSVSSSVSHSSGLSARERRRLKQKQERPLPASSVALNPALPSPLEVIASRVKRLQENSGATPKHRGDAVPEPRRQLVADSRDSTDGPARGWQAARSDSRELESDSTGSELEEISQDEPALPNHRPNRKQSDVSSLISALDTTLKMTDLSVDRESPDMISITEEVPEKEEKEPVGFDIPDGASPTTSGRLRNRIVRLRDESVRGIGEEMLMQAYHIIDSHDEDFVEDALVKLMGRENFEKYGGPIWQLKFCESFRMR